LDDTVLLHIYLKSFCGKTIHGKNSVFEKFFLIFDEFDAGKELLIEPNQMVHSHIISTDY
jgi:hypothetical protein